jgi:hypothetical protein
VSFVRVGEDGSDVYIYADSRGYVTCCWCPLDADPRTTDRDVMLAHVADHRQAGHHVPDWVDARLEVRWPDFNDLDSWCGDRPGPQPWRQAGHPNG